MSQNNTLTESYSEIPEVKNSQESEREARRKIEEYKMRKELQADLEFFGDLEGLDDLHLDEVFNH